MPNTHCGWPNSAAIGGKRARLAPREIIGDSRFHQPDRSDTKMIALPSGDHSGWKINSAAPPAIASGSPGMPSAPSVAR